MSANDAPPLLRPQPQRSWQLTPMSTEPPTPRPSSTDAAPSASTTVGPSTADPPLPETSTDKLADKPPPRSRSILNLTSSTLFGIYSGPGAADSGSSREDVSGSVPGTPWGNGSMTPAVPFSPTAAQSHSALASSLRSLAEDRRPLALRLFKNGGRRRQDPRPHGTTAEAALRAVRNVLLLFALGVAYGVVVTHLHERTAVAPVKMEGTDRHGALYLGFWGCAGAGMGVLLPWLDSLWEEVTERAQGRRRRSEALGRSSSSRRKDDAEDGATDWTAVMRGIGAFVGIAFAIRRLPWESTLQASLTLALSNPVLWYLVDRSATGFLLATAVGMAGTAAILGSNPDYVPAPGTAAGVARNATAAAYAAAGSSMEPLAGLASAEGVAVSTWVASVLFYSCVCFGNIGRVLAFR